MGRERGSASGTIGNDLKALIQKAFIPDLLQRPPFGFNKVIMIGYIRIVHICPEAYGTGKVLPHSLIFPNALLAFADKGIQAVLLDLLLAV